MLRFHFSILLTILLLASLVACVSNRPKAEYISAPDYNTRVEVRDPYTQRKLNAVGISTSIGFAVAGGYLGAQHDLIRFTKLSDGRVGTSTYANAAIGALVGYGVANLGNHFLWKNGHVKRNNSEEAIAKWARRYNKQWIPVKTPANKYPNIVVMSKQQESVFIVKDILDLRAFRYTFPNSIHTDKVVTQAIANINRNDLPELLTLYPNTAKSTEIQQQYVLRSKTFGELTTALDRFPRSGLNVEDKAAELVSTPGDAISFIQRFPASKHRTALVNRVVAMAGYAECEQMLHLFNDVSNIIMIQRQRIQTSPSLVAMQENAEKYPNVMTAVEVAQAGWKLVGAGDFDEARRYAELFSNSPFVRKDRWGVYVGTMENEKRHGTGFFFENDFADKFYGTWANDKRYGYGEFYEGSGKYYYKGNYFNDEYSGQGEEYLNGDRYKGAFISGRRSGAGEFTYKASDDVWSTYKGNFTDGYESGKGRIDRPNGEWLEGSFLNGQPHGVCTHRTPDGFRITGNYKQGIPVGKHQVQKWVLFGLVDTYKAEIVFDNDGNVLSSTEHYDINKVTNERVRAEREERDREEEQQEKEEKYFRDFNYFKERVTLRYDGESDPPLNIGFDGRCPCQEFTLKKANIIFDDHFNIYKDSDGKWWVFGGMDDDGPFLTEDGLLEFIYKNHYQDK